MITTTKKLTLSYNDLENIVTNHLYFMGQLQDNEFITLFDMDVPLNEDGLVEFDVDVVELEDDLFDTEWAA